MSSIGEVLSDARRQRGLSLKDAEQATRIRSRYLVALEHDDFSSIPGYTYARAFIREYSAYLSIDPEPLVEIFNERHQPAKMDQQGGHTAAMPSYRRRSRNFMTPRKLSRLAVASMAVAVIVVVIALVVLLKPVFVGGSSSEGVSRTAPQPSVTRPNKVESARTAPSDSAAGRSTSAVSSTAAPLATAPVRLGVTVTGRQGSWLRVTTDGKRVFQGILDPGAKQSWSAEKEITVRAGDAGELQLVVNDGRPRPLGDPRTVVEVKFDRRSR